MEPDVTENKTVETLQESLVDAETRSQTRPAGELLDGAILSETELGDSVSFQRVFLRNADLTDADLAFADLTDANLASADLTDAYLTNADLADADLASADLTDAVLSFANLPEVNLFNADLPEVNLFNADLPDAFLRLADLNNANLYNADLYDAFLKNADLTDANLRRADLIDANLEDSDLSGVDAFQGDFINSNARNATFTPAPPDTTIPLGSEEAARETSHLYGIQRFGVTPKNLESGLITSNDIEPIDEAPLPSNLEDAVLENTDLRGATLTDARLYQTDLTNARINARTTFGEEPVETIYERRDDVEGWFTESTDSSYEAGAWVHRRLERLHDENALSQRARQFHIRKQEAERSHHSQAYRSASSLAETASHLGRYLVFSMNGALTRHGESLQRIVGIGGGVILVSAALYPIPAIGGIESTAEGITYQYSLDAGVSGNVATLLRSLYFSIITFSTIGYGDHFPAGPFARLLVGVESLLGAILIALFIFVLGRRTAR